MMYTPPVFYKHARRGNVCGKCDSSATTHRTTTDNFVGCWMFCDNYECEQSYNAERQRTYAKIKELEDKLAGL